MAIFDPINLKWAGRDYHIPAQKVFPALARVEEVITLQEILEHGQRNRVPMIRLASAYGAILRYAGAEVEDEQVYLGMFDLKAGGAQQAQIMAALTALLMMLLPPEVRKAMETGTPQKQPVLAPGETDKAPEGNARARSRATTSSRSRKGGARRRNSGR